jgi:prevent-host-death family protein
MMHKSQWRLQDAKTQFSQVVEAALQGEPQHVTRRGREAVIVLSEANYRSLRASAPGFVAHLLAIPKDDCAEPQGEARLIPIALREIDL